MTRAERALELATDLFGDDVDLIADLLEAAADLGALEREARRQAALLAIRLLQARDRSPAALAYLVETAVSGTATNLAFDALIDGAPKERP